MDWLNIHTSTIDSPAFIACDPVRRATWLMLSRFCIGQENGGLIKGCSEWGDTTWQQMARVRLREVNAPSTLWTWDGNDLRVAFYPSEKEREVRAKRESGRLGGRPPKQKPYGYPDGSVAVNHEGTTCHQSAETEGKGKEGEGKGKGMEGASMPPPLPDDFMASESELAAAKAAPLPPIPPRQMPKVFQDWRIGKPVFIARTGDDGDMAAWVGLWNYCEEVAWEAFDLMTAALKDSPRIYFNAASDWIAKNTEK
jgi:hypothetical protein